ncbi:PIN domain-containing protein [Kitasatospora sp. NPDC058965]|uniref:PIN domain-containing protein n=1 Tax=Kitasatospora sp. NPDC058965 TaxID=3346682 RepID=UPI0036C01E6E
MIIFDTNAVNLINPDSSRADIIRKLRRSGHHAVAVPWMVLEEMVAHQAKQYMARHQAVVKALTTLKQVMVWDLKGGVEEIDLERFQEHWRRLYGEIFDVIETSGKAARKALAREALALPPARQGEKKAEGGRDAAIWFSILEYLEANPGKEVCFVTNNHKDFGDGTTYPYPMDQDLSPYQGRLTRLKNFDEVVAQYTTTVSGKDAGAAAEDLLRSVRASTAIGQIAASIPGPASGFLGLTSTAATVRWKSWVLPPQAELLEVTDVTGHEIEGDTWYTANTSWLLVGVVAPVTGVFSAVACTWRLKILFSTKDEGEEPTILTTGDPLPPAPGEGAYDSAMARLSERGGGLDTAHQSAAEALPAMFGWPSELPAVFDVAPHVQMYANPVLPTFDFGSIVPKLDLGPLVPTFDFGSIVPKYTFDVASILPKYDLPFAAETFKAQYGVAPRLTRDQSAEEKATGAEGSITDSAHQSGNGESDTDGVPLDNESEAEGPEEG